MKNKVFQKVGRLATAAALALALIVPSNVGTMTAHAASDVTVNLASKKQMMQGIGGINHPIWTSDLTAAQRQTAFGNGDNELGFTILRIHVDENKNNWSKELPTAQAAAKNGALIFASPWNPPASMCEKFTRNGKANQQRLKYSSYAAYAQHLNDFVSYMKQNGVELYAISVQNEPDYADTWTWWTPQEMLNFMKNYAGKINCRVIAPESFQYLKNMSDPILNDPTALANMDILGTHFYGTQRSQMSYPLFKQKGAGKELWMTEVYVPDSTTDADVWPNALEVAVNMNDAFAVGDMQAYVWWYIRRSYSPMKENGQISKRGYCMAQYSKFIRRGYYRVDATMNPATNVYVSAYTGDGKAVIVATNNSNSSYSQRFTVSGGNIKKVDRYRTSSSENLAKTTNLEISSNGFYAQLPAKSVSTFVCDLGTGSGSGTGSGTGSGSGSSTETQPAVNTGATAKISDGWYYIKNTGSQKYLQVTGNTAKANTNVEISTGTGSTGQKWKVTNTSDGYITLTSALGDFMLDVASAKNEDGTNIGIYNAHGGDAQKFQAKATSQNNVVTIVTKASNGTKALDVYNFGTSDGTNVCQWSFGGKENQTWVFEPTQNQSQQTQPSNPQPTQPTETGKIADGWYYIKGVASQKYLQVAGNTGKNVTNVNIGTKTGVDGQLWKVTSTSNGYFTLTSKLGDFGLDIGNGSAENGANAQIYALHGGDSQQFTVKATSQNGAYSIATKCSNGEKVLDVEGKKTADGTNVCQYTNNGQTNQMWIFEAATVSNQSQSSQNQPSQSEQTQPSQPEQTQPATTGKLGVSYTINSWGSGYQVSFKVENKSGARVNSWTVTIPKSELNITASWNVSVKESGNNYVITPVSWNATIENGNSVEFGVQGSGSIGTTLSATVK